MEIDENTDVCASQAQIAEKAEKMKLEAKELEACIEHHKRLGQVLKRSLNVYRGTQNRARRTLFWRFVKILFCQPDKAEEDIFWIPPQEPEFTLVTDEGLHVGWAVDFEQLSDDLCASPRHH
ncbi:hypothetical protein BSKO_02224 [Bryopsis sp. KO-2023]|nr:hypothetical protein BSKO_02224 [Bryopsis sp. KO-2023]